MSKTSANILTIPAGAPFAETLARGLIARFDPGRDPLALSAATIFLPTQRAARTLTETFAKLLGGAALLPQMRPLGEVDEDEFLFDGDAADELSLPPAIAPLKRRFLLARLIQRWDETRRGQRLSFAQAASLARGLAHFQDEAETQGADLSRLDDLVPAHLARHWEDVRRFLSILRDAWPAVLAAEGAVNPIARRNEALRLLAARYAARGAGGPVIAAGSTGSIPATAELLRVIATMPDGMVVLPGLDQALDEESWQRLDEGHPQFGMKQLLERIGLARGDVRVWDGAVESPRALLLRETLRPAPTTDAWQALAQAGTAPVAAGLKDFALIEAAHPQEEASAIALILRELLETPGRTAALVTPDRGLARRVAVEMARWDIAIDDSAGKPLASTPPGAFLTLLADAAHADFAPVALLALLKHPLAAGGEAPAEFRRKARALDRYVLRGPRPDAGFDGILRALEAEDAHETRLAIYGELKAWLAGVADKLQPFAEALKAGEIALSRLVELHGEAAEALAATPERIGAEVLWRGDAGRAARQLLDEATLAAGDTKVDGASYAALLRTLALEKHVRLPYGGHPRLTILGPLEARLQSFDVAVLGGLNENAWPRAAAADPWLSRPMRKALGLEAPERAIGLSAHDFAMLAAAPTVFLTRALKVEGSPSVPSRWLQRLIQLTQGLGFEEGLKPPRDYIALANALEQPRDAAKRMERPAPRPPVAARPRALSVTEVETWLRDPYAIYAKHVLKLRPLDPLEAELGPLERGTAIHAALEEFLRRFPKDLPADAEQQLIAIARAVFVAEAVPKAMLAVWMPRFLKAALWFVAEERGRHFGISDSFVELLGVWRFTVPGGPFELRARADRIDVLTRGGAAIVDYKTGTPPTKRQVKELLTPQLPLEGAILRHGGFEAVGPLTAEELLYIQFAGGAEPGKIHDVSDDITALVGEAERLLIERVKAFDNIEQAYMPRVMPYRADVAGDYDHLSRVREWSLTGWEESE